MAGIVVAFVGVFLTQATGIPYFDGGASIVIGGILAGTAVWLAYETKGLLIGESANAEVVAAIRSLALEAPEIEHVNEVLTMHMGPDYILVNLSVDFITDASSDDVEAAIHRLERAVKTKVPRAKRIFVEPSAKRAPA
jgi:divalent metal cation (Fe/Co/Zn/Cd) transporter